MRLKGIAVATATVLAAIWFTAPPPVYADDDAEDTGDELVDLAVPQDPPPDTRPTVGAAPRSGPQISTMSTHTGPLIEDFLYHPLRLEGYAYQVCYGSIRPGTQWTFWELVNRFGGTAGTMYSCRERWDAANNPDCRGRTSNHQSSYYTTCWSTHAEGRALDIMVGGSAGGGYNLARGRNITNWLLARDQYGNLNANARRLGVQQILFADRCWNANGDRGIGNWNQMRQCGIGHFDHVHIDLTYHGANGNATYWGREPGLPPQPKVGTQVFLDFNASWRQAVSWHNLQSYDEDGLAIPAGFDKVVVGDFDRNRILDDVFFWNRRTGEWLIQKWRHGNSFNMAWGRFSHLWDEVVIGDFAMDGFQNDMILWDGTLGVWVAHSWNNYVTSRRATGKLWNEYDVWISGDFSGNGFRNDTLIWDKDHGYWRVHSWNRFQNRFHNFGQWPTAWDELIVGDWNAGGSVDEALLWNSTTGEWLLQKWDRYSYRNVTRGRWNSNLDVFVPGDYYTRGRLSDLYVYNSTTGQWWIFSFHRYVATARRSGTWLPGWDHIIAGALSR